MPSTSRRSRPRWTSSSGAKSTSDTRLRAISPAATEAFAGSVSQAATRGTTAAARNRSTMTSGVRKLSCTNSPSVAANCSLRSTTMAVWGMGTPSGWRNSAVTANQSASPPTMAASAAACA